MNSIGLSHKARHRAFTGALLLLPTFFSVALLCPSAHAVPFNLGQVFASVGNGEVQQYDAAGNLLDTLDTTQGGFTTGCAFDSAGNLYVTDFGTVNVTKFDGPGDPHSASSFGSGYGPGSPESILFDGVGNVYVGHAGGDIHKLDGTGTPLTTFTVGGSDWIDLAADQCTMIYGDEGITLERFDVCTNTALTTFATGLSHVFALRILPGAAGVLVADSSNIKLLDTSGNLVQTYDAPGEDLWFALNLDPNGTSFWSGDFGTANFYKFNIASTAIELGPFNTGTGSDTLFGLCVFGEITSATENCTNGIDDDGDGQIDCADPDCQLDPACQVTPTTTPAETATPVETETPVETATPVETPTPIVTPTPAGALCGNGVVDPGETCDDGNTVEGCRIDRPQKPSDNCENNCTRPMCKDPSRIYFGEPLDRVRVHGRIEPGASRGALDPTNKTFTLRLSDAGDWAAIVFEAGLATNGDGFRRQFTYRNREAMESGGIALLRIRRRDGQSYAVTVEAYGNLRNATSAMTTHLLLDDEEWTVTAPWAPTPRGWRTVH